MRSHMNLFLSKPSLFLPISLFSSACASHFSAEMNRVMSVIMQGLFTIYSPFFSLKCTAGRKK